MSMIVRILRFLSVMAVVVDAEVQSPVIAKEGSTAIMKIVIPDTLNVDHLTVVVIGKLENRTVDSGLLILTADFLARVARKYFIKVAVLSNDAQAKTTVFQMSNVDLKDNGMYFCFPDTSLTPIANCGQRLIVTGAKERSPVIAKEGSTAIMKIVIPDTLNLDPLTVVVIGKLENRTVDSRLFILTADFLAKVPRKYASRVAVLSSDAQFKTTVFQMSNVDLKDTGMYYCFPDTSLTPIENCGQRLIVI